MKTVDWTELKEGDIFEIPHIEERVKRNLLFNQVDGTVFKLRGGHVQNLSGGNISRHPSHPDWHSLDGHVYHQPVVVIEENEVSVQKNLATMQAHKVNESTGTDPEIFVVRGVEKEELLPAFKFLPTQHEQEKLYPNPVSEISNWHPTTRAYAYRDGFAAEYFTHPCSCHGYLIDFIKSGLQEVSRAAKAFDRTARLTVQGTFKIPDITMENAKDEDIALGCMPSKNAYGHEAHLSLNPREFKLRFAGGHVHLGIPAIKLEQAIETVKGCDLVAGMAGVAIFADIDDPIRRTYYGRAGEYRKPRHGIEYRTLSNAWLACPQICHLMFNLVRAGAKVGYMSFRKCFEIREEEVEEIINNCDVKAARKFLTAHKFPFNLLLAEEGLGSDAQHARAFEIVTQAGLPELFPNYKNVEDNWQLTRQWDNHSDDLKASWDRACRKLPAQVM